MLWGEIIAATQERQKNVDGIPPLMKSSSAPSICPGNWSGLVARSASSSTRRTASRKSCRNRVPTGSTIQMPPRPDARMLSTPSPPPWCQPHGRTDHTCSAMVVDQTLHRSGGRRAWVAAGYASHRRRPGCRNLPHRSCCRRHEGRGDSASCGGSRRQTNRRRRHTHGGPYP